MTETPAELTDEEFDKRLDEPLGDGWYPCPTCDGEGGSNAGPLEPRIAPLEAALLHLAMRRHTDSNACDGCLNVRAQVRGLLDE